MAGLLGGRQDLRGIRLRFTTQTQGLYIKAGCKVCQQASTSQLMATTTKTAAAAAEAADDKSELWFHLLKEHPPTRSLKRKTYSDCQ